MSDSYDDSTTQDEDLFAFFEREFADVPGIVRGSLFREIRWYLAAVLAGLVICIAMLPVSVWLSAGGYAVMLAGSYRAVHAARGPAAAAIRSMIDDRIRFLQDQSRPGPSGR